MLLIIQLLFNRPFFRLHVERPSSSKENPQGSPQQLFTGFYKTLAMLNNYPCRQ